MGARVRCPPGVHSPSTILGEIRSAGERFAAREAAQPDRYPAESVADLLALGLFSAPFPADLGGSGQSLREAALAIEVLAEASPSLALLACMPVGFAGVLSAVPALLPDPARGAFAEQ